MENNWKVLVLEQLEVIKGSYDPKQQKALRLPLLERIIDRVDSYSQTCEVCQSKQKAAVSELIGELESGQLNKTRYNTIMKDLITHLKSEHNLYEEGQYQNTYMTIGMSLGMVFGLTIFKTIGMAVGMSMGMAIGLAIGSGIDKKNQENNRSI